jgi:hypothetical protein
MKCLTLKQKNAQELFEALTNKFDHQSGAVGLLSSQFVDELYCPFVG